MKIEIRADNTVTIEGYVNAVGRDSRILPSVKGKFVEQIEPKTFERAMEKAKNIELKHNHKRVIGSTNDGVLSLNEDNIGLYAKATTNDSVIREKAINKELRGWSFGFEKVTDEWEETRAGVPRRIIKDLVLNEVSIIDNTLTPCYVGTSIESRGDLDVIYEVRADEDGIEIVDNSEPPKEEERAEPINYEPYMKQIEILKIKQPI